MKNILFVSDAFLDGGLETRIAEQVIEYKKNGFNVSLICDSARIHDKMPGFHSFKSDFNFIPKNGAFKVSQILESSKMISDYCKEHRIDFIECQPFWCLIPATIAAEECNIPISYTLHGTASGNFINPDFFEANIVFYLCLCFGVDELVAVSERLAQLYSYVSRNILIARNNICFDNNLKNKMFSKNGCYAIGSRLDSPKTAPIKKFLLQICNISSTKRVDIYGDGDRKRNLANFIKKHNLGDKVYLRGWVSDLPATLNQNNYDCVFGIGRIVTDAIASHTPAGILGYGGFAGLINKENIQEFAATNFISWDHYDDDHLKTELRYLRENPKKYIFKPEDLILFNAESNWKKYLQIEQKVRSKKKPIVALLSSILEHHKDEELFLGISMVEELINVLDKIDKDAVVRIDILHGYKRISQRRSEELTQNIQHIEQSLSWKVTKPLRKINSILKRH